MDALSRVLWELKVYELVKCLNLRAGRSRVYGLSQLGIDCRRELCRERKEACSEYECPDIDWELYGWICFSHRSAVIKALEKPLQPAAIKRKARFQDSSIRMSANNVRDVMKLFLEKGIVHQVWVRPKVRPRYELTKRAGHEQVICREEISRLSAV